jgi:hypothetical protein
VSALEEIHEAVEVALGTAPDRLAVQAAVDDRDDGVLARS